MICFSKPLIVLMPNALLIFVRLSGNKSTGIKGSVELNIGFDSM